MTSWINFDAFVDLIRDRHHESFTGLITGISGEQHAFKVGFDKGEVVLLTYRIKKGMPALQLMMQMQQVKITEYPSDKPQYVQEGIPDTTAIMSRLTANTLDETDITSITEVPELIQPEAWPGGELDEKTRKIIELAAVHHFGPIGAMVCDEILPDFNGNLRETVLAVAVEVGASDADTKAFLDSIAAS